MRTQAICRILHARLRLPRWALSISPGAVLALACLAVLPRAAGQAQVTVGEAVVAASSEGAPEISTEELNRLLTDGRVPVLDVRSAKEHAIAHIPGSINLYEREAERLVELYPDRSTPLVLYCNGPYCGKSKRLAARLAELGYTSVRRYQLGLPFWRALGNTVQTDLDGFRYVFTRDRTAVFVDARSPDEFRAGTVPGAVNVRKGEAEAANDDGRLPYTDKGTRVIVFGSDSHEARAVAEEIAHKAYWNSSYFGGRFEDLRQAGLW